TRKKVFLHRFHDGRPIGRDIDAPTRQALQKIWNHLTLGPDNETDEAALGPRLAGNDTFAFRLVSQFLSTAARHRGFPEAYDQAPASWSASTSSAKAASSSSSSGIFSVGSTQPSMTRAVMIRLCASSRDMS